MSLRLITGAANSGKTGEIVGEALAAAAAGASPVIAVPDLADARRLEAELSGKTSLGIRVSSARQLVHELWIAHGDGRRIIGPQVRGAIVSEVVARGDLGVLVHAEGVQGLSQWMERVVRSASVRSLSRSVEDNVATDLIELLDRYRRALADRGLVEEAWVLEHLGSNCPLLDGPLGVARFDSIDTAQARFVLGLAQRNAVSVALTWEPEFMPTRANDDVVAMLASGAAEHLQLVEPEPRGEIAVLARAMFSGPSNVPSRGAVVEGRASGLEAESALVAQFVSQAIGDGFAPDRIVVAFPKVGRRLDVLAAAFREARIPAEFDASLPLGETPFGRAFLGLAALATGSGGRAEAVAFGASLYSGADRAGMHRLDRQWRRDRVGNSTRILDELGGPDPLSPTRRTVDLARRAGSEPLPSASAANWKEVADRLLSAKAGAGVGAHLDLTVWDGAAHQAVVKALAELAGLVAPVSPKEVFQRLLRLWVTSESSEPEGRVQVCGFDGVGSRRFDVVVLGGLTEAEASNARVAASVEQLQAVGLGSSQDPYNGDLAKLQFYSLVTRARRRLVLVRQEADGEGRETRASSLYLETVDVYRNGDDDAEADVGIPLARATRASITEFAPALTQDRRNRRREAASCRFGRPERAEIVSASASCAIGYRRAFAVTEIEAYLACPHRWFYERVVRPEEIDSELDARELGTRTHEILATFYRRLIESGNRTRVDGPGLDDALALLDSVSAEQAAIVTGHESLAESLAMARAAKLARGVVTRDASFLPGFYPAHVELSFGDDCPFEFAGRELRGRIDRIDVGPGGAFVTDYKLSSAVSGVGKFERAGLVQAVVYALAASSVLGTPVVGFAYRSLASGKLRGFWRQDLLADMPQGMCRDDALDSAAFDELLVRTEERVGAAIDNMSAGHVQRVPAVDQACKYCGISSVCEGARR